MKPLYCYPHKAKTEKARSLWQKARRWTMNALEQRVPRKHKLLSTFAFFLLISLGCALTFTPLAFARTKVQCGEITNLLNTDDVYETIEKVDLDKSFIIFDTRTDENDNSSGTEFHAWAAKFTNITTEDSKKVSNQVYFKRQGTGESMSIVYYVIESDIFQVEYIETSVSQPADATDQQVTQNLTNLTENGAVVDFEPGDSFVVSRSTNIDFTGITSVTQNCYNTQMWTSKLEYDEDPVPTVDRIIYDRQYGERDTSAPVDETPPCDLWAFVVKMRDDSTVYQGITNLNSGDLLGTTDIKDTGGTTVAVDRTKSFLLFDKNTHYSSLQSEIRGALTSDIQVGFNRRFATSGGVNPGECDAYWYVIELGTLGRTESGEALMAKGESGTPYTYAQCTQATHTLGQAVDPDYAYMFVSQDSTGGGTATYRIHRTAEINQSDGSDILFRRGEGGQHAVVDFIVTELEPMVLFAPNGDPDGAGPQTHEVWQCGDTENITWYAPDSIANVELLLSNNSGTAYNYTITTSTANDGQFEWEVPKDSTAATMSGVLSDTLRIKVRDVEWDDFSRADDKYSSDESDADFEIIAKIQLDQPDGGENWNYGDQYSITWTLYGAAADIGNLVIKRDENSGDDGYPTTIIATYDSANSPYGWTVNAPIGTTNKVRLQQVGETRVYDASAANFTVKGDIILVEPDGTGDTWNIGETPNIQWQYKGTMTQVRIKLSRDNGVTWEQIEEVSAGSAYPTTNTYSGSWKVNPALCSQAKVKIESMGITPSCEAITPTGFPIAGDITVVVPDGAETWNIGEDNDIRWTRTGTYTTVEITLSRDGGLNYDTQIEAALDANNNYDTTYAGECFYTWTVPGPPVDNNAKIKIKSNQYPDDISDVSDATFTIFGGITLSAPDGGENWELGVSKDIAWTTTGDLTKGASTDVEIWLSRDNGVNFSELLTTVAADSTPYPWTVTGPPVDTLAMVRIKDVDYPTILKESAAAFTIYGDITVVEPDGTADTWNIGEDNDIRWTTTGDLTTGASTDVKISLSTDGGLNYSEITTEVANLNYDTTYAGECFYTWEVPGPPVSSNAKIKIEDVDYPSAVNGESALAF
ncbi:hypothetical protein ACFL2I_04295, partial [Candidatus Omnitrophota bacterium]